MLPPLSSKLKLRNENSIENFVCFYKWIEEVDCSLFYFCINLIKEVLRISSKLIFIYFYSQKHLTENADWFEDQQIGDELKPTLQSLCARYNDNVFFIKVESR